MKDTIHDPRSAALRQLASAYDYHSEEEQIAVQEGEYDRANRHHQAALIAVTAFKGEADHPDTPGLDL